MIPANGRDTTDDGQPRFDRKGLKKYLASRPPNTPDTPYTVRLEVGNIARLNGILRSAKRYVSLDLSGCAITAIPHRAFCNKDTDEETPFLVDVTIPGCVTSIGGFAFGHCVSLESIAIPDSVISLGEFAFVGCTSLTNITIPDRIVSLGECAFWDCTSLKSVTIPDGVVSLGYSAFEGCASLANVTFLGTIVPDEFAKTAFYHLGDLRRKYLSEGGGPGMYTTAAPVDEGSVWTKQT